MLILVLQISQDLIEKLHTWWNISILQRRLLVQCTKGWLIESTYIFSLQNCALWAPQVVAPIFFQKNIEFNGSLSRKNDVEKLLKRNMSTQQKRGQNMFCRMTNDSTHNEKRYFYSILAPLSRTQDILHMYGKHQK